MNVETPWRPVLFVTVQPLHMFALCLPLTPFFQSLAKKPTVPRYDCCQMREVDLIREILQTCLLAGSAVHTQRWSQKSEGKPHLVEGDSSNG